MSSPNLDTLAKAPLFVNLAIVGVNSGPTATDSARFNEHVEASSEPNARNCVYTETLQHLTTHFQRLYAEVTGLPDTAPLIEEIQGSLSQQLTPSDKLQFLLHLGRVAAAAVRDDNGHPVPERVAMADQLSDLFNFMGYGKNNERYTDELQVTTYWPGIDPALQRFTEAELRQLSIDREVGRRRPRAQHIALRLHQLVQDNEQAQIAVLDRLCRRCIRAHDI